MYYLVQMYGRLAAIPEPNMGLIQLESGAGKSTLTIFLKQRCSISTGICIVALTGRSDETLGNSRENRESWQVC